MPVKSKPIFRKVISPFYNTETACIVIIFLMLIILLFGITGIAVALETPRYSDYIWVPVIIVCLSFVVFAFELIRFIRHYINRN